MVHVGVSMDCVQSFKMMIPNEVTANCNDCFINPEIPEP